MAFATVCAFGAMTVFGREGMSAIPDDAQGGPWMSSRPTPDMFGEIKLFSLI
jgi:hypothetical protein